MRPNTVRRLIDGGGVAVNAWISGDSAYSAEVLGHCGFDSVTVDCQHGMLGRAELIRMLAAISATPAVPMVRPATADPATIGWCLDAGAYGVIVPDVDSGELAEAVCRAALYPPLGSRSFGPSRGLLHGGPDYAARAHEELTVWAMVESRRALENLDEILATPGLYGVYVGPNDLALDLGLPAGSTMSEQVASIADDVRSRAQECGVRAGIFCAGGEEAATFAARGFDLVTPGNDMSLLRSAAAERIAAVRGVSSTAAPAGY